MTDQEKRLDALLDTCDFIEREATGRLDMNQWGVRIVNGEPACGTEACLLGFYCGHAQARADNLRLVDWFSHIIPVFDPPEWKTAAGYYDVMDGLYDHLGAYFGISASDAEWLFRWTNELIEDRVTIERRVLVRTRYYIAEHFPAVAAAHRSA